MVVAFALTGKDTQLSVSCYHKRSKAGHYFGALLFAPCKGILLVESEIREILLLESVILGFWNPQYHSKNPESLFH